MSFKQQLSQSSYYNKKASLNQSKETDDFEHYDDKTSLPSIRPINKRSSGLDVIGNRN